MATKEKVEKVDPQTQFAVWLSGFIQDEVAAILGGCEGVEFHMEGWEPVLTPDQRMMIRGPIHGGMTLAEVPFEVACEILDVVLEGIVSQVKYQMKELNGPDPLSVRKELGHF